VSAKDVVRALAAEGVKIGVIDARHFRAVTHYGITREDIDVALMVARKVMSRL
jgi:hypothetical protein